MESGKVYRSETREPHHMYVLNLRKGAEMSVIFVSHNHDNRLQCMQSVRQL